MKLKIFIILTVSILAYSCKNKPEPETDSDSGLIEISKAQFETEKMVMGTPELQAFADKVHFTGTIIPSVDGQAKISLPIPGIVSNIRCKPAQMVKKGTVLFEISGHWFIDLQKDYAESSALLSKLVSDYKRVKELSKENIGTQKEYVAVKSSYYAENAKHKALEKQLNMMGLDVAKIKGGKFYSTFPIKSPISGYVSSIDVALGQYIEPQKPIIEIVDNNTFQLQLSVFEKDLQKMEIGQNIEFYFNGDKSQIHEASLNAIGKTIMPHTKAIVCYANIKEPNCINMALNQFAEGDILTAVDTLWALPETAIIKSEDNSYILLYEKKDEATYYFKKVKIDQGRIANNYIEIKEHLSSKKLLLSGTYNIAIE